MKEITLKGVIDVINALGNFGLSPEQLHENLTDLGMDSIKFVQIVVTLEEEFECEIPDTKLLITEMDTVQKIMNVLKSIHNEPSML